MGNFLKKMGSNLVKKKFGGNTKSSIKEKAKNALKKKLMIVGGALLGKIILIVVLIIIILLPLTYAMLIYEGAEDWIQLKSTQFSTNTKNFWLSFWSKELDTDKIDEVASNYEKFLLERFNYLNEKVANEKLNDSEANDARNLAVGWVYGKIYNDFFKPASIGEKLANYFKGESDKSKAPILKHLDETINSIYVPVMGSNVEDARKEYFGDSINLYDIEAFDYVAGSLFDLLNLDLNVVRAQAISDNEKNLNAELDKKKLEVARKYGEKIVEEWSKELYKLVTYTTGTRKHLSSLGLSPSLLSYNKSFGSHNLHTFMNDYYSYSSKEEYKWFIKTLDKLDSDGCEKKNSNKKIANTLIEKSSDFSKLSHVASELESVYVSYVVSLGNTNEQQSKLKELTKESLINSFVSIYTNYKNKYDSESSSETTKIEQEITADAISKKMEEMIQDLKLSRTQQAAIAYRDYLIELEDVTTVSYYAFDLDNKLFKELYDIHEYSVFLFDSGAQYSGDLAVNKKYYKSDIKNLPNIQSKVYISGADYNPIVMGIDNSSGTDYFTASKSIVVSDLSYVVAEAIKTVENIRPVFDDLEKTEKNTLKEKLETKAEIESLKEKEEEYDHLTVPYCRFDSYEEFNTHYEEIRTRISNELESLNLLKDKINSLNKVTLDNDPYGVLTEAVISTVSLNGNKSEKGNNKEYVDGNILKVKKYKNTQEEAIKNTASKCFPDIVAKFKSSGNKNKDGMVIDIGDLKLGASTVSGSSGYAAYKAAMQYYDLVQEIVEENHNLIDPYFIIAMIAAESSGDITASSGSAVGLMQIEYKYWGKTKQLPSGKYVTMDKNKLITDPRTSIEAGLWQTLERAKDFHGNLFMTVVGYNMGKYAMERIMFLTLVGENKIDASVWTGGPSTTIDNGIPNRIDRLKVRTLIKQYAESGDLTWLNYRKAYQEEKWYGDAVGTLKHLEKVLSFYNSSEGMPWYRPSKDSGKIIMGSSQTGGDASLGTDKDGNKTYHKNNRLFLWKEYYTDKDIFKAADNWFKENATKLFEKAKLISSTIIDKISKLDETHKNLLNQIDISAVEFKSIVAATLNVGTVVETSNNKTIVCQPGFKVTPTTINDTESLIDIVAKDYIELYKSLSGKDKDFAVYIYFANDRELAKLEVKSTTDSFVDFVKNKYKEDKESFTSADSHLLKVAQVLSGDLSVDVKDFFNLIDNVSTDSSNITLVNPIDEYYQKWLDAKYLMHEVYNQSITEVNEERKENGDPLLPLLPTYDEVFGNDNNKIESDIEGTITLNGPNGEFYAVQIKKKFLTSQSKDSIGKIEYIVIHDTGDTTSKGEALQRYNIMNSSSAKETMHYVVGSSDIYHMIENNYAANHINDSATSTGGTMPQVTNANSLGVQFEANSTRNKDKVFWHTVAITKYLMQENSITDYNKIVLHNDVTGTKDSAIMLENNKAEWTKFKDALKNSTITFTSNSGNLSATIYNLVETARSLLGQPYVYGATGQIVSDELINQLKKNSDIAANGEFEKIPRKFFNGQYRGFDCSSFVQYVYKQNGITISRTTYSQVKEGTDVFKIGEKIVESKLQAGDLMFSDGHVIMWIGNGEYIHAPYPGEVIKTGKGIPSNITRVKRFIENSGKFEFYSQHDSRWASVRYSSDNISGSGCGPTSTAMVLSGLNHNGSKVIDKNGDGKITPDELANYSTSKGTVTNADGTTFAFYPNVSKELGVNLKEIVYSSANSKQILEELKAALKSGKGVVASYGPGHWIPYGGHLIALVGISNDNRIIVHDPNLNTYQDTRTGRYNGPNPDSNIVGSNANPLRFFIFG